MPAGPRPAAAISAAAATWPGARVTLRDLSAPATGPAPASGTGAPPGPLTAMPDGSPARAASMCESNGSDSVRAAMSSTAGPARAGGSRSGRSAMVWNCAWFTARLPARSVANAPRSAANTPFSPDPYTSAGRLPPSPAMYGLPMIMRVRLPTCAAVRFRRTWLPSPLATVAPPSRISSVCQNRYT